jgi:hypothetical protein
VHIIEGMRYIGRSAWMRKRSRERGEFDRGVITVQGVIIRVYNAAVIEMVWFERRINHYLHTSLQYQEFALVRMKTRKGDSRILSAGMSEIPRTKKKTTKSWIGEDED